MNEYFKSGLAQIHAEPNLIEKTKRAVEDQINKQNSKKSFFLERRPALVLAIASFLLIVFGGLLGLYYIPIERISVDINPSLSVSVNYYGFVSQVNAYNEDAVLLLEYEEVKGLSAQEAFSVITQAAIDLHYLSSGGESIILIAEDSSLKKRSASILTDALAGINDTLQQNQITTVIREETITKSTWRAAKENNISAGRYQLIQEIKEQEATDSEEDLESLSVWELVNTASQNAQTNPVTEETTQDLPQDETIDLPDTNLPESHGKATIAPTQNNSGSDHAKVTGKPGSPIMGQFGQPESDESSAGSEETVPTEQPTVQNNDQAIESVQGENETIENSTVNDVTDESSNVTNGNQSENASESGNQNENALESGNQNTTGANGNNQNAEEEPTLAPATDEASSDITQDTESESDTDTTTETNGNQGEETGASESGQSDNANPSDNQGQGQDNSNQTTQGNGQNSDVTDGSNQNQGTNSNANENQNNTGNSDQDVKKGK